MNFLFFAVIYFLIVNRTWIKSFFEGLMLGRAKAKDLKDKKILKFIESKTGLKLQKIKLLNTDTAWGLMAGLPGSPYMVISQNAFKDLNKDEIQWLLLHEAGHYILWHNIKVALIQFFLLCIGFLVLKTNIYPFPLAILLGIILASLYIQIARYFEYEANNFALKKMDNPKGLKNLYLKVEKRFKKRKDTLWDWLFNIWILDIHYDLMVKSQARNE